MFIHRIPFNLIISDDDFLSGDVNSDGNINVADIVLLINIIIGEVTDFEEYLCSSDLNDDGIINVQDIILIVGIILS